MVPLFLGANQLCDGLNLCSDVYYVAFSFAEYFILLADVVD